MNTDQKAIFIDKDGTLIIDIPYNVDPGKIELTENCITGLKKLQAKGYLLVIITNQSGVSKGYFKEEALADVKQQIVKILAKENIYIDGFYYCPHHPDGIIKPYAIECNCRKPHPGLLFNASGDLGIDLQLSWMIGDILNDVEAGNRAGCNSVLIDNGNETEWIMTEYRIPAANVKNINEAADYILNQDEK